MADDPISPEDNAARFRAQLAQLRLMAQQAEDALQILARQMRGTADTPVALRSDEISTALLARVGRRDTTAAP